MNYFSNRIYNKDFITLIGNYSITLHLYYFFTIHLFTIYYLNACSCNHLTLSWVNSFETQSLFSIIWLVFDSVATEEVGLTLSSYVYPTRFHRTSSGLRPVLLLITSVFFLNTEVIFSNTIRNCVYILREWKYTPECFPLLYTNLYIYIYIYNYTQLDLFPGKHKKSPHPFFHL